jgi:hypothetical protein
MKHNVNKTKYPKFISSEELSVASIREGVPLRV